MTPNLLLELDRGAEALQVLQPLIARLPKDAAAHGLLGRVLDRLSQADQALDAARMAARLAPTEPRHLLQLCGLLNRAGNLEEAEEKARLVIAMAPNLPNAHYLLGIVQGRLNRIEEAVESVRRAIDLAPNDVRFQKYRDQLMKQGEQDR